MATGLLALLDDVAGLAKIAAASLDDAAGQAARAGAKAAGVVIDDAAVTPRYVVGFAAERELPIVGKIALGSVRNKLIFLLPAALLLSLFAPWAITPLLMAGGLFLCFEGAEKVLHALAPAADHAPEDGAGSASSPEALEDQKVSSAIKTDFILSAEIMALTLATLGDAGSVWMQGAILALVGLGITAVVYGGVGLIVKADDAGVSLAGNAAPASTLLGLRRVTVPRPGGADRALAPLTQAVGRGLVRGMPLFLKILGIIGTAAMVWVGGGIILHGLEGFGVTAPAHLVHDLAGSAAASVPVALHGVAEWLVTAAASGVVGLAVGAVVIPVVQFVLSPLLARFGKRTKPEGAV